MVKFGKFGSVVAVMAVVLAACGGVSKVDQVRQAISEDELISRGAVLQLAVDDDVTVREDSVLLCEALGRAVESGLAMDPEKLVDPSDDEVDDMRVAQHVASVFCADIFDAVVADLVDSAVAYLVIER